MDEPSSVERLWEEFKLEASADARERPILHYAPLAGAINRRGEREKIGITRYHYEGLTLAEIGQVLGVTESRVCQLRTKAVLQLRAKLRDAR